MTNDVTAIETDLWRDSRHDRRHPGDHRRHLRAGAGPCATPASDRTC
jgi:hypothetical protein